MVPKDGGVAVVHLPVIVETALLASGQRGDIVLTGVATLAFKVVTE